MDKSSEIFVTKKRPQVADLDSLPLPRRSMIDYEKYNRNIGLAKVKNCITLQATRGCPYDCAYCSKIWPKSHMYRSPENLFKEISLYYDIGIRRFSFVDDIFNLNEKNSGKFFELVIKNRLDIQIFFPAGLRGDIMSRDFIDLMVEAGTINMALALETASPRLQKLIKKNLNILDLKKNIDYICRTYPHVILDLFAIYGFPTETEEEALMTLDFIKHLKWLHFPYIYILKIYPNTDMEKLAIGSGISRESILKSMALGWNELPETIPFDKNFAMKYKTVFLDEYFFLKERLRHVLPFQLKILTEEEIIQKYNSYFSFEIESFSEFLEFVDISIADLETIHCASENRYHVHNLNDNLKRIFAPEEPVEDALRILLLDLSQSYRHEASLLDDLVEVPLGLIYLLTYLNHQLGNRVNGKIVKSRIDFDNDGQLEEIFHEFKPDVIGVRTLTFYKDFAHRLISKIRLWGFEGTIISGGPYATSDYSSNLDDPNIDIVVLGEGEVTFSELIRAIINNRSRLPGSDVLREIEGVAFRQERYEQNEISGAMKSGELRDDIENNVISRFNDDLENE